MRKLSEQQMIAAIAAEETFHAQMEDGSFEVKITSYVPYIGTAIHAGHRMRDDLLANCLLDDAARLLEEDPFTDQMVQDFPITLVGCDSRYEYDLNRGPDDCVYDVAWGVKVWREPLSDAQKQQSLDKHACFYRIMRALCEKLEQKFGGSLLLDTHSYNWRIRDYDAPPVFNIGTEQLDEERYRAALDSFDRELQAMSLPGLSTTLGWNAVFYGRGYQATIAKNHLGNTLVVPLEVKKIFMDETTGVPDQPMIEALRSGFNQLIEQALGVFLENSS
jgi:N-formylglutamate amidohydrolase